MKYIKSQKIFKSKNVVKGSFFVSDGSRTNFRIDREIGWQQWGNNTDNLSLSVDIVEKLQSELLES